jgi:outer membrane protein assembly factor BamB
VRGELRALDLRDGSVRARCYLVPEGRLGADIWNSAASSPDGRSVLVATGNDFGDFDAPLARSMVALDPVSLAVQAAHQVAASDQDLDFGTTPVFFSDAAGRTLVGANQKNGVFYAYDLARLATGPAWTRNTGLSVGLMPAYDPRTGAGGTLFIAGDNAVLYGVDPATGGDRWPPIAVGFGNGNLAVANGLVFMGAGHGAVAVIDAETGVILRVLYPETPELTYSGVVLSRGILYWTSGPYLNAWGLP